MSNAPLRQAGLGCQQQCAAQAESSVGLKQTPSLLVVGLSAVLAVVGAHARRREPSAVPLCR